MRNDNPRSWPEEIEPHRVYLVSICRDKGGHSEEEYLFNKLKKATKFVELYLSSYSTRLNDICIRPVAMYDNDCPND